MLKARGGLLSHAHSARGALLQQQAKHRSLSPSLSPFSRECSPSLVIYKSPLSSRGFRGFLPVRGRGDEIFACTSFHGCSQNGLKQHNILALWSFESRNPLCDDASRLGNPKFLHTSTRGKLTTSELIKRVQLATSNGSKSPTSTNALVADDFSIEKQIENSLEKGHGSKGKIRLQEVKPSSEKLNEECTSDRARGKMLLSKTIPEHVVDRGFLKKEAFSKNQTLQSNPRQQVGEVLQKNRQKGPNQRHNLPILQLSSTRNDTADDAQRVEVRRNGIKGSQQKDLGWSNSSRALQMSQRRVEVQSQQLTENERIGSGQLFVGGKLTENRFERPQESVGLPGVRNTEVQCRNHKESIDLEGESTLDTKHLSISETAGMQTLLDNVRQCQKHGEGTKNEGGQPFARRMATEREFSWCPETIKSAGEKGEIVGKQPFHWRLPGNTQFWRPNEGMESASRQPFDKRQATDTQFQVPNEKGEFASRQPFDRRQTTDMQFEIRRDSEFSLPGESMSAAPRKPFDRNRPRRKFKNELKEKDLSLQPIVGEPHYEYILRRKRVRAEAQKALVDDVDDYEHVGDDWVRKRLGWLCKEIPVLKASGLVKMLNNQRKWIKQEHLVELIEHLVRYMELNRAHRVLKWMQQQPLYKFEYDIHNNMAYILGRNDKQSRCQDVFDEIVRNGKFPDGSVFTALIKAYLTKGDQGDINDAWKLYNQMLQLDLKVSPSLFETLLKSLTCPSGHWIRQAEELLVKMRASGLYINEEMYTRVLNIYGKRGDHKKVDALITEMKKEHLETDVNVMNASLAACVKDGDTQRAENTYRQITQLGLKPNWYTYAYLIQVYGKAKSPTQAWDIFVKMKGASIPVNFVTYHAIIEAMAANGLHVEQVMQVLIEVEESGIKPLQPCYNSIMNMFLKLKRYEDVESIFKRGKAAKVRPAHAAYNMLLKSYTDTGQLEKAEAVFQEMKATEGMGPNTHTYNILLEGYGVGCFKPRVRELFEEMSAKGCQLDPDVQAKIKSMIGVKKIVELEKKKLILTDEQREIIPGLLLGGAKMESPDRNRTYELHLEFNCENQVTKVVKDHLSFLFQAWWKQNELAASTKCKELSVEASSVKSLVRLETISHGSLRFYAHQYRPNGEPVIPKLIHRWLKPRTLAYWYMYGGRKCRTTGGIVLNASKYTGKQIQLVVKALKARTMDCRRKKKRNGDVIRFQGKSALWLWKLMEPHILKAVREQLKPEEIPVNLDFAEGNESCESHDQASSDEDDWDDLEAEKDQVVACT